MSASDTKSLPAIGFLTVIESPQHGLFGGYLVLNTAGRPLEFHCTAPVKANRAQEILYGRTLRPYLYGEQIGQTLLRRARNEPLLVCTDVDAALSVRDFVNTPVALVLGDETSGVRARAEDADHPGENPIRLRIDPPHDSIGDTADSDHLIRFQVGPHLLAVPSAYPLDRDNVVAGWQPYADGIDLGEPFSRIREAIEEAQRR